MEACTCAREVDAAQLHLQCVCSSVYAVRVQCACVAHAVHMRCAHAVRVPHRAPLGVDKPLALGREPPVALIRPAALVRLGRSGPGLGLGFGGVHLRGHVDRGSGDGLLQVRVPVARRRSVACSSCATRTRLREGVIDHPSSCGFQNAFGTRLSWYSRFLPDTPSPLTPLPPPTPGVRPSLPNDRVRGWAATPLRLRPPVCSPSARLSVSSPSSARLR